MEPMHDEHVNVTPLIDVVMCLIIFFLLAGKLAKDQNNADIIIPRANFSLEMFDQEGRLPINIVPPQAGQDAAAADPMKMGKNANVMPEVWVRGKQLPMSELVAYLRKEKKETPNAKIVLRADQDIAYQWIAPVLVACAQADIKSVNFSTRKE
jgi:biopolymer transport protein ExbD